MKLCKIVSAAILLSGTAAFADFVSSPDVSNGNSVGSGPFLITSDAAPSYRYQQVHSSNDFANVSTLPLLVTEISFAAHRGQGYAPVDVNLANIDIRFSTTGRTPDSLSPTFAQNTGSDETIVFSGPLHFYDTGGERFGIHVQLQHPFIFDYQVGNLLLDIRNYAPVPPSPSGAYAMEAQFAFGDSVSALGAINVNAASGTLSTVGYVTRFAVTPVPEPGTWALLLIGTAGLTVVARKRVVRATNHGQPK